MRVYLYIREQKIKSFK